ncbi:MAG: hypothetical protein IJ043_01650 [Clostridia bacterium]|nr:hypothetical protein [Clostridia bacterium]
MNCYKLTDPEALTPAEATPEEEALLLQAAKEWSIGYHLYWECIPRSDSGIDHNEIKNRKTLSIPPETIVLKGNAAVGCYYAEHLFLFADESTHTHSEEVDKGYTGGWGDITETHCYQLKSN